MKTRNLAGYFLLGALVYSLVSIFQNSPGYMDSDYYAATGVQITSGKGFLEPFIWNYLNNPEGIPTPSHLYWMPLASILAAIGMVLYGSTTFFSMKLPFVFMAAMLVPATVLVSRSWIKEKSFAWLGGLCAAFSGIYWIYLTLPETFALYMLLGAMLIMLVGSTDWLRIAKNKCVGIGFLVGILCGLMHLTRADGILWVAGCLIWVVGTVIFVKDQDKRSIGLRIASTSVVIILGYLLVMGVWYIRNLNIFGTIMPPGNSKTLWLTEYNQTFNFSSAELTYSNWIQNGSNAIFQSWWKAFKLNLGNMLVVQGGIALFPLIIMGGWRFRKDNRIRFSFMMWLITVIVMTVVFPFAGARGGYLHSGAAFQIVLWALVPIGLESLIEWGASKRNWKKRQAFPIIGSGLLIIALLVSGYFYYQRVVGPVPGQAFWNQSERNYQIIGRSLAHLEIDTDEIGVVNNPPGYYLAIGRSSIVIPNGDIQNLLEAARKFNATYLILEPVQENLKDLYSNPNDQDGLAYLGTIEEARIFRILPND
jgi:hypothetical protein